MESIGLFSLSVASTIGLQWSRGGSETAAKAASDVEKAIDPLDTVTISCPGKVLIAGGYLVLEEENIGVTVGATARFYVSAGSVLTNSPSSTLSIVVKSPQFRQIYHFEYSLEEDRLSLSTKSASSNSFVEKCLQLVFSFVREHFGVAKFSGRIQQIQRDGLLEIKLRADNDFYSQTAYLRKKGLPVNSTSLKSIPAFAPFDLDTNGDERSIAKTGLGSSAALTTALVGAVLQWFQVVNIRTQKTEIDLQIIHNLAQLAHCAAQGKIGSGFDVAAAVFGSQTYRRFDPLPSSTLLSASDNNNAKISSTSLHSLVMDNTQWTQEINPFALPPGCELILGDVAGGSNSPSMAKAVLAWRASQSSESISIWQELGVANTRIVTSLSRVQSLAEGDLNHYAKALRQLSKQTFTTWQKGDYSYAGGVADLAEALVEVRLAFESARTLLRHMGELAGVGIEPPTQTNLLDRTLQVPGVLAAGVPGAGGHDAVFVLVFSMEARRKVELLWEQWTETKVCPLLLAADSSNQEKVGVCVEVELPWRLSSDEV